MSLESLFALFGAMFVIGLIPGPGVFALTSTTLSRGVKHALLMIIGLTLADYVFIILAVLGLSAVASAMGEAFILVKYLCAAYLIWMGWKMWRSNPSQVAEDASVQKRAALLGGFVITMSNPKAILFYVALFPAFVDVTTITVLEIGLVMLTATLAFGTVNLSYVWVASKARNYVMSNNKMALVNRISAGIMALTGTTIALRD